MAGQVEYYVTHQLFLSDVLAVYIVVTKFMQLDHDHDHHNIQDDDKKHGESKQPQSQYQVNPKYKEQLRYWLSFLKSLFPRGSKIPTVLAITHLDKYLQSISSQSPHSPPRSNESADLDRVTDAQEILQSSVRDYSPPLDVAGCVALKYDADDTHVAADVTLSPRSAMLSPRSLQQQQNQHEKRLREMVMQSVSNLVHSDVVPGSYVQAQQVALDIRQELRQNQNQLPLYPLADLKRRIQSQVKILEQDEAQLERAIQYLHSCGTLFKDDRLQIVVLDPMNWFPEVLSFFIGGESNRDIPLVRADDRGVIRMSDVKPHKQHLGCTTDEQLVTIFELLERLDLCFKLPHTANQPQSENENVYLFPCLMKEVSQSVRNEWWPALSTTDSIAVKSTVNNKSPESDSKSDHEVLNESKSSSQQPAVIATEEISGVKYVGRRWKCSNPAVDMLPPAFFPTLQAKLFQKYNNNNNNGVNRVDLARGIAVITSQDGNNKAMLQYFSLESRVDVVVRGQSPYVLLAELFEMVESIVEKYRGLELNRYALCSGCLQHGLLDNAVGYTLNYVKEKDDDKRNQEQEEQERKKIPLVDRWRELNFNQRDITTQQQTEYFERNAEKCPSCKQSLQSIGENVSVLLTGSKLNHEFKHNDDIKHHQQHDEQESLISKYQQVISVENQQISSILNQIYSQQPKSPSNSQSNDSKVEVFLCHAHTDKPKLVKRLAFLLHKLGIKIFYDDLNAQSGNYTVKDMANAVHNCGYAVVFLSDHLFDVTESHWPTTQLQALLQRATANNDNNNNPLQIIPVWCSNPFREHPVVAPPFQSMLKQIMELKSQIPALKCDIDQQIQSSDKKYDEFVANTLCPAILKLPAINKPDTPSIALMDALDKEYTPEFPYEGSKLKEQV